MTWDTPPVILEQIVREQIADRRDQLEAIVRREVERIVGELVAAELNGHGTAPNATNEVGRTSSGPPVKLCRVCGVEKPGTEFDKGRRVCKGCRRTQHREWQAGHAADSPSSGVDNGNDEPEGLPTPTVG